MDRRRPRLRPLAAGFPVSGRLDAFEWRVPLAGIGKPAIEKPAIEQEASAPAPMIEQKAEPAAVAQSVPPSRRSIQPETVKSEPVIPLVHAPDDPGPEAEPVEEIAPRIEAPASGWRKMFE